MDFSHCSWGEEKETRSLLLVATRKPISRAFFVTIKTAPAAASWSAGSCSVWWASSSLNCRSSRFLISVATLDNSSSSADTWTFPFARPFTGLLPVCFSLLRRLTVLVRSCLSHLGSKLLPAVTNGKAPPAGEGFEHF